MPQRSRKFTRAHVEGWSVNDVKEWLISVKLEPCTDHFVANGVNGVRLLQLTNDDIKIMPCNQSSDKQRKLMKKVVGSLPGNSVSKSHVREKKTKQPKSKEQQQQQQQQQQPSPQQQHQPPPPPSWDNTPLTVPSTFAKPPLPSRDQFSSPGSGHIEEEQDMYEPFADGLGPEDDDGGIYDCPDEMVLQNQDTWSPQGNGYPPLQPSGPPPPNIALPPPPSDAPPPPSYPPQHEDGEEQEIYDEYEGGESDVDDEFVDDSFSSGDASEEDYESPFEDDPQFMQKPDPFAEANRTRAQSDATIRTLMGKFYAHGLKEHTVFGSVSSSGSSHSQSQAQAYPEQPSDIGEEPDDIYDVVPDELKDEIAQEEEGIMEDIYDIPPDELVASVIEKVSKPPAPPPPEDTPPDMNFTHSKAPAPPPPASPPPIIEEDIYDAMDEDMTPPSLQISAPPFRPPKSNSVVPGPTLPPKASPTSSPAFKRKELPALTKPTMRPPIESKPAAAPPKPPAAPPSPPTPTEMLPPRPPKPDVVVVPPPPPLHVPEPDVPTTKPPPPPNSSSFNKPMLRRPIGSGVTPPKNVADSDVPMSKPPPPPTGSFNKPKLRSPVSNKESRRPPDLPSSKTKPQKATSIEEALSKLSSPKSKIVVKTPSPTSSPQLGRKPLLDKDNNRSNVTKSFEVTPQSPPRFPTKPSEIKASTKSTEINKPKSPELGKRFQKRTTDLETEPPKDRPNGVPKMGTNKTALEKVTSVTKPPTTLKTTRISEMMKKFEKKQGASVLSTETTPVTSPQTKASHLSHSAVEKDKSPISGRKIVRKESVDKLMKKFQKPSREERAMSPDKPFLPPKPSASKPSSGAQKPLHNAPKPSNNAPRPPSTSPKLDKKLPTANNVPAGASPGGTTVATQLIKPPWMREPIKTSSSQQKEEPKKISPKFERKVPPSQSKPEETIEAIEEEKPSPKPVFVYKPYTKAVSKQEIQVSEPKPPQREVEEELPRPPIRPTADIPRLPDRNPPNIPPSFDSGPPRLPNRPPPSGRPSTSPPFGDGGPPPQLPSRLPPHYKPPTSEPSEPTLPPRPLAQVPREQPSEFAAPPLPSRPWHNRGPEHPPVVNKELPLPSRPPKTNTNFGSPRGKSWYHSSLDRKQAETKLKRYNKDGTFIIRDSTKIPGEYSLSICHSNSIRHLRIRLRGDKKFVLGEEKSDELAFETVMDLVDYHKKEPLHLRSGGETTLRFECPR